MEINVAEIDVAIRSINEQLQRLRKAVEDGIYDLRSIVGDATLLMEIAAASIRDAVINLRGKEG